MKSSNSATKHPDALCGDAKYTSRSKDNRMSQCLRNLRFPRPCRLASFSESFLGGRFCLLPGQLLISQSPTDNLFHCRDEPLAVVRVSPVVIAEYLFIHVAEQMKRFYAHVGAAQAALEQAPEVLQPVQVELTVHVRLV